MADISAGLTTGAAAALEATGGLDRRQQSESNKATGAAKDFEALLLGQILKPARGGRGLAG